MSEAFAAFELIRGLCAKVEADVIAEIDSTESEVMSHLSARGEKHSSEFVFKLAEAIEKVIEHREATLIDATKTALRARPPAKIDQGTTVSMVNFLMDDLGMYYNHGGLRISRSATQTYIDGLPPDLRRHEARLRTHLRASVEIALAEVGNIAKQPQKQNAGISAMDIFISHSNEDKDLASALIDLLLHALNIRPEKIRCTSVDGYRLGLGANTDEQIRMEVCDSQVLIGLITPTSVKSSYVLFELGARWGAKLSLGPLLAKGATADLLPGPISGNNALSADNESQMHQFLRNIAAQLSQAAPDPSIYTKQLKAVVRLSDDSGVLHKFDGMRIKGEGDQNKKQYFVIDQQSHYLDEGAAEVCDRAGLRIKLVDPATEAILLSSHGTEFNSALMQFVLVREGAPANVPYVGRLRHAAETGTRDGAATVELRLLPEQESILCLLWDNRSYSTEAIAGKLSQPAPSVKYHIGVLEERRLVHIPLQYEGEGAASITQEGRAYVYRHKLIQTRSTEPTPLANIQTGARHAAVENAVLDFLREAKGPRNAHQVSAGIARPIADATQSLARLVESGLIEEGRAKDKRPLFMMSGLGLKWPDR